MTPARPEPCNTNVQIVEKMQTLRIRFAGLGEGEHNISSLQWNKFS